MIRLVKDLPVDYLQGIFPELSSQQLRCLVLFMNFGSYSKISILMGCSEHNVKKHIQRCKEALNLPDVNMLGVVYNARVQCGIMRTLEQLISPAANKPVVNLDGYIRPETEAKLVI